MILHIFLFYFSCYVFAFERQNLEGLKKARRALQQITEVPFLRNCYHCHEVWKTPYIPVVLAPSQQMIFSVTVNSTHWATMLEHPTFDLDSDIIDVSKVLVYVNNKPSISDYLVKLTWTSETSEEEQYNWCDWEEDTYYLIFHNVGESPASFGWRVDLENDGDYGCDNRGSPWKKFWAKVWTIILILFFVGVGACILCCYGCPMIACCYNRYRRKQRKKQRENRQNDKNAAKETQMTVTQNQEGFQPGQPTWGTSNLHQVSQQGLPPGWEEKWDAATQKKYWVNHFEKRSQWEDPRGSGFDNVAIPVHIPASAPPGTV